MITSYVCPARLTVAGKFAIRLFAVLSAMVVLIAGSAIDVQAQTFRYQWSGTIAGVNVLPGQSVVIDALLVTTSLGGNEYRVDSLSGTVTDNTAGGIDFTGTINAMPSTAAFGTLTPRNRFFFPNGGTVGVNNYFAANLIGSGAGGFRFSTTSGHEYFVYGDIGEDLLAVYNGTDTSFLDLSSSHDPLVSDHSITQVPGPLAGAGMLSWLVTMLMGLVWRRRGKRSEAVVPADKRSGVERQWLIAKFQALLPAMRLGR